MTRSPTWMALSPTSRRAPPGASSASRRGPARLKGPGPPFFTRTCPSRSRVPSASSKGSSSCHRRPRTCRPWTRVGACPFQALGLTSPAPGQEAGQQPVLGLRGPFRPGSRPRPGAAPGPPPPGPSPGSGPSRGSSREPCSRGRGGRARFSRLARASTAGCTSDALQGLGQALRRPATRPGSAPRTPGAGAPRSASPGPPWARPAPLKGRVCGAST